MSTPQTMAPSSVECPKCGKHTVVELSPSLYRCLNCSFERDFSKSEERESESKGPGLVFAVITSILLLLVI